MDFWFEVRFFFTALLGVIGIILFAVAISVRWWLRRRWNGKGKPVFDWLEHKIDKLHLLVYAAIAGFVLAYVLRFWGGIDITDY